MGLVMKRFAVVCVLIAACAAAQTARAQTTVAPSTTPSATLVVPPAPLLPANDHLVANDQAANVPADKPELAAILAEDGLQRIETRAVINGSTPVGWVRAYQFVDATGAFAAYTFLREGGRIIDDPHGNAMVLRTAGDEHVYLRGVSVVRMQLKQGASAYLPLLGEIETGLPKIGGRKSLPPILPTLFPRTGYDPATLRYALGPVSYQVMGGVLPASILAWDKSAEVGTASYSGKSGHGTLTMLLYPTPEIAGIVGRAIEQAVNQRGQAAFGTVKLRRVGPLLGFTSGDFTPAQAQELIDAIQLHQQVSFDKDVGPLFHVEIRRTATLLQSIAIFTGLLIVAALVLGVFFGGARAGIRLLQGKSAASEPEFLTIDLHGRPAPLQPPHPASADAKQP
jgi:hypothetical protein